MKYYSTRPRTLVTGDSNIHPEVGHSWQIANPTDLIHFSV